MTTRWRDAAESMKGRGVVLLVAIGAGLIVQPLLAADFNESPDVRDLLATAVTNRLGSIDSLEIEVLDAPANAGSYKSATPAIGARVGGRIRFTLSGPGLAAASVLARVSVIAPHVVARQPIARNAAITADDVDVRHEGLDGVLLQPLPTLDEALAGRPRRAIAVGEIVTSAVLARTPAVRAGDEVAVTIRAGAIEASGVGRAISSGFIGDVIRITRPGSREPSRARVLAPASVEICR